MTMQDGQTLLNLGIVLHPDHSDEQQVLMAVLASRIGYSTVIVPEQLSQRTDVTELLNRLRAAVTGRAQVLVDDPQDDLVVRSANLEQIRARRSELDHALDPRPLCVSVPVSIGRTMNEAVARASRDPRFVGATHPEVSGIFGTFEQAQTQVIALADAGAQELWVTLADDYDISDLLAQVKALVVGPTVVLHQRLKSGEDS